MTGLNLIQFNTWRIEWLPDRLRWLVNGSMVREQFDPVPDNPQRVHFIFWAAYSFFGAAYSASLQPADNSGDNEIFHYEVDWVRVESLTTSPAVLPDPGFESGDFGFWSKFGNAYAESPPRTRTGDGVLKMFQAFTGSFNVVGSYQILAVTPGDEYGFCAWARNGDHLGGDTMQPGNSAILKIEWLDSGGSPIPDSAVEDSVNARIDPSTPPLQWNLLRLRGTAPANAVQAQVLALHIYSGSGYGGGASYFDDFHFCETADLPLRITEFLHSGTTATVTWNSDPCAVYRLQRSTDLVNWHTVVDDIVGAPHPAVNTQAVDDEATGNLLLYRVAR